VREKLKFATDATIITRLGKELVAKQETALIELVKNAFDADATRVDVIFGEGPTGAELQIVDNGNGMGRDELVDGFLRLSSNLKVTWPYSPVFARKRAGRKGIGRFAAHRLGERLTLTTRTAEMPTGLRLYVDWSEFSAGRDLSAVEVTVEDAGECAKGTTLQIDGLHDPWTDAQIRRCFRGVLALQQPFPVAPVEGKAHADPGFLVRFKRKNELLNDETAVADLQTEILDHLHAIIEMHVDDHGHAAWRLTKNRFGELRDWQPIHHEHLESRNPPPYASLRRVWMKAHYVILMPELLPSLVLTRVRDVLADSGGIRLYRNGFRVVPYGDPDNDWLRLDEMYAKRSILAPIANRNFFGIVEIQDSSGTLFEEHTSREGLIETPAFSELRKLASSVLVTAGIRISEDRGRKTRAGNRGKRAPISGAPDLLAEVTEVAKAVSEAAEKAAESGSVVSAQLAEQVRGVVQLVESKRTELARVEADLIDEASMLRFLATLGMTAAEFNHETGMTFDAFRLDFERILGITKALSTSDDTLRAQVERAEGMLRRLDTLTSYLNSVASARSARAMTPISLTRALQEFSRGMKLQAQSQGVSLVIETPPYDPLFTRPMHQAEIASILLNFYTNAVKAIKRRGAERKISVSVGRVQGQGRVQIRFSDTGDGIPVENRERVFDAFYTTSAAPSAGSPDVQHAMGTGLGLWIVQQIVDNAGGEIRVVDGEGEFATCLEVELPAEGDNDEA
jgi:signal transduction histidine kinase